MENLDNTMNTENNTESTSTEAAAETKATKTKEPKAPKTPAWTLFHQALEEEIKALGLEEEVQENYVQIRHAETGQRVYLAKQDRAVTSIPTTLPLGDREGISRTFSGKNGRIKAEVEPTVDAVKAVLQILASGELGKVPAPARKPKAKAEEAQADAPAPEMAETVESTETVAAAE